MAGPGYQSDAAAMTRAVSGFDEAATNTARSMAQLESELMSVLSRYAGNQATAFWQLQGRLQESMRVASRELQTMSGLVNESFRNYNTGDVTAADSLRNLSGAVGEGSPVLSRLAGA
ncbi:WXG100 family type VII secretion target [Micromonospora sagamiensis]|uniref:WXG100 family type VII secretion target n=1 Tax=Micromonospora sagamiensis TaxID=47875 RepID=A0A562WE49_9ACTN|nr:hypothetical protein [Micromonospora sagamiensis]TWJ28563.1 hypothetical protein JD81_02068 [Micromonospora sagamiensis]BCL12535.1 hypothetical protein GCM10017556_02740 [Micromonospora sagamiensis]